MQHSKLLLQDIELFVLDMDGTFYLGESILEGSLEFIERLRSTGRRFLFFTNNSSRLAGHYRQKLAGMGCKVEEGDILTSGDVTTRFLQAHYSGRRVYLLGTPQLEAGFSVAGIQLVHHDPHMVVVGYDTTLTYEKLEKACRFIRGGAEFIATHPDINCPTEQGFVPDCGAMCALITSSTGRQPRYMGKPYAETVALVQQHTGVAPSRMAFVGDRLYTDVATGVNNGAKGFLVLTGEAKREDVQTSKVKPTAIFASLGEMARYL